jgi:hypothetical protein
MYSVFYLLGKKAALEDLGQSPPLQDATNFVQAIQKDSTEGVSECAPAPEEAIEKEQKPIHWSSNASLESGDIGTRGQELGLPRFGGV